MIGLIDKVRKTIKKYRLIDKNDKVLVGVSAGPDSVTLLYVLNAIKKELKISLHIAHLDHMLRDDSCKDREFVELLGKKLNLPVTAARINVKKISGRGSLEEIARNARFKFFLKVAKTVKADKIALGHNLDDQAETVLMRIIRGAGLYGLCGISPNRDIFGYTFIRPLIEVTRKEIEAFLKRKGITSRIDYSNYEDIYLRNKIRNNLLPLLKRQYNSNIKEILSNIAESASLDYDYLNSVAQKALKRMGNRIVLDKFLRLHPAIQRLVLRLAIAKVKGDMRKITFQHIRELESLIFQRPVNSIVDLPKGISAIKKKKYLHFYLRK